MRQGSIYFPTQKWNNEQRNLFCRSFERFLPAFLFLRLAGYLFSRNPRVRKRFSALLNLLLSKRRREIPSRNLK